MNWEAISAIGQAVGAFAVVVSLIYLATEVRSNARPTREASLRSVSDAVTRWLQQLTENPHLADVYHRGLQDYESLEAADSVGFRMLILALFRQYQEIYYLRLGGVYGVSSRRACATSTNGRVFRLGGVHTHIGSLRSLRSTLINYSREARVQPCIANQSRISDLTNRNAAISYARLRGPPA